MIQNLNQEEVLQDRNSKGKGFCCKVLNKE